MIAAFFVKDIFVRRIEEGVLLEVAFPEFHEDIEFVIQFSSFILQLQLPGLFYYFQLWQADLN